MLKTIWASLKYQCRELFARINLFLTRLFFWQWKRFTFPLSEQNSILIQYAGRKSQLAVLKMLLGSDAQVFETKKPKSKANQNHQAFVYEVRVPGALRIPHCLSTVTRSDRPAEEILATYSKSLRRSIVKRLPDFHYETLTDASRLEHINQTMLIPYAEARNAGRANHLNIKGINEIAFNHYGRLDLLYEQGELIGCHLGHSYSRKGKRYWQVNRFGYVKKVFDDYKKLQEANAINLHLALLSAIDNGYDYCDYGMSLATPGKGLIEWKRRRKGFLTKADGNCFFLKPPKEGSDQFFWDAPLFALESKKVTLHLGVLANKTDEEIIERYREMGYDGLRKVYLHCQQTPNENVLANFASLYTDFSVPPEIIVSKIG